MQFWKKWKSKLWIQLGLSILVVNLSMLLLSFLFQYWKIKTILLDNSAKYSIDWFKQSEININKFCQQLDFVLMELVLDSNLRKLSNAGDLSVSDRVYYAGQVMKNFGTVRNRNNYSGIRAICYYGDDGFVLKNSDQINYVFYDSNKEDWYYSSAVYQEKRESGGIQWVGGYTDYDFGLVFREREEENYLIFACRDTILATGKLMVYCDVEYLLDIFYANEEKTGETLYIIDENDLIVAARDEAVIGITRQFRGGECIEEGIIKYIEEDRDGKRQIVIYSLPFMGWRLVKENLVSEVTKDTRYMRNILLVTCFFCGVISFALSMFWLSRFLKPLKLLTGKMQKVTEGEFGSIAEKPPENEIGVLMLNFNRMSVELKQMFARNQYMEEEKRNLEMKALRAQINPHLIYNTLNTIKWMAIVNEEWNIAKSITLLSDFLEPVFKKQGPVCTVKEELDYIKNYIEIMNLRSGDRYALEIDVSEEYYGYQIIRFLLQPVVENSIRHGFEESISGKICISMQVKNGVGIIRVEDDGKGIDPVRLLELQRRLGGGESSEEAGVGIANVNRRIKLYYGNAYGVTIQNREGRGMAVTITISLTSKNELFLS